MKAQEVKSLCEKALEAKRDSLSNIAFTLGSFTWAIPTLPYAQSHYRSTQRFYLNESKKLTGIENYQMDRGAIPKGN
jgi:hypothetical protein